MATASVATQLKTGQDVVRQYEELLALSDQMIAEADAEDWEQLIADQVTYVSQVEALRAVEADITLSDTQAKAKFAALRRILEQDRDIRERLLNRREQLGRLLSQAGNQRKVARAYQAGA